MTTLILRGHEFYVRLPDGSSAIETLARAVGDGGQLHREHANPFCVVLWSRRDFDPPEHIFELVSRELPTDVIWLAWQKQVDAFAFQLWTNGLAIRRLCYGVFEKERTWELVDGTPEPWGAEAFFRPQELELQLQLTRRHPYPGQVTEAELRRIWTERALSVDSEQPQITAIDAAYAVARHYRLPGWRI